MEFIATFNTILIILYRSVLLVEETEVHRPAVSH
jgi:energy-converting hydrogenase Eha subunit E